MKHVPQRTCIGCHSVRPKRELVRVVRTPEGEVLVDASGRRAGRGAYICPDPACLERALSGNRLERALECAVPRDIAAALDKELRELISLRLRSDASPGRPAQV